MNGKLKVFATVLLIAVLAGVGFELFKTTGQNMTYFYKVDEITPQTAPDRTIKINGIVAEDGLSRDPKTLTTNFIVEGKKHRYPVTYVGPLPDIFRPGIQVVVGGRFDHGDHFKAKDLMAKCPSKYTPKGLPSDFKNLPQYEYDYRKYKPHAAVAKKSHVAMSAGSGNNAHVE